MKHKLLMSLSSRSHADSLATIAFKVKMIDIEMQNGDKDD